MALFRKRYYSWLFKAYIKKWRKTIVSSIVVGVCIFFAIASAINLYFFPNFSTKVENIGLEGTFSQSSMPEIVLSNIGYGLTRVLNDGSISPAAASRWEIADNGKEYIFYIKKGQVFPNGKELTSNTLPYQFKDVQRKNLDTYKVSFKLKNSYSPFLASVSKPILINNFQGLGDFRVTKIETNGGFLKSVILENKKRKDIKKHIFIYPTEKALLTAFMLGEIDTASGILRIPDDKYSLSTWRHLTIHKEVNYSTLVTLFFNTQDQILSNKKTRQALSYSLPENFKQGTRALSPIPPVSLYFSKSPNFGISDLEISKSLIFDNKEILSKPLIVTTFDDFSPLAQEICNSWKKLKISCKIDKVSEMPATFQIFLYQFKLPADPDQYTLWHSGQISNISRYKNLRIDKLLEDGRSISDVEKRKAIYSDFQKYLIDDAPASFLFFPNKYTITKKRG